MKLKLVAKVVDVKSLWQTSAFLNAVIVLKISITESNMIVTWIANNKDQDGWEEIVGYRHQCQLPKWTVRNASYLISLTADVTTVAIQAPIPLLSCLSYLAWTLKPHLFLSYLVLSICIYLYLSRPQSLNYHDILLYLSHYPIPFSFQFSETSQLQFCWCPLWDKSRCLRSTSIVSCVAVFPRSLFTKLAM